MLNDPFLKQLREIDWNLLSAAEAVELRATLTTALKRSDEWYSALAQSFNGKVSSSGVTVVPKQQLTGEVVNTHARSVKATVVKERSSRAKKNARRIRTRHPPIAVGGADAEDPERPPAAHLFENSYVSTEGPDPSVPWTLPAGHPRANQITRVSHPPSSVSDKDDMRDFHQVETMNGEQLRNFFNPRG